MKVSFEEAFIIMQKLVHIFKEINNDKIIFPPASRDFKTLFMFYLHRTNSLKEIKEHFIKHTSDEKEWRAFEVQLSKSIKSLSSKGLIKIERSDEDKRLKTFKLTQKAEEMIAIFLEQAKKQWEEIQW